jgi:hypothetical protein
LHREAFDAYGTHGISKHEQYNSAREGRNVRDRALKTKRPGQCARTFWILA